MYRGKRHCAAGLHAALQSTDSLNSTWSSILGEEQRPEISVECNQVHESNVGGAFGLGSEVAPTGPYDDVWNSPSMEGGKASGAYQVRSVRETATGVQFEHVGHCHAHIDFPPHVDHDR